MEEMDRSVGYDSVALLTRAKQELLKELEQKETSYSDFRRNAPLLFRAKADKGNLETLLTRKAANEYRMIEIDGRVTAAKAASEDKNNRLAIEVRANLWAAQSGYDRIASGAKPPLDLVPAYLESLEQEREDLQKTLKPLEMLIEAERGRQKEVARYEMEDEVHRREIERRQQLYEGVIKRLNDYELGKEIHGYHIEVIVPPHATKK